MWDYAFDMTERTDVQYFFYLLIQIFRQESLELFVSIVQT